MASLTDTYRLMKGEEPVNKERITEDDKTKIELSKKGGPGSVVTQKFIDDMKRIRNGEQLVVEEVIDSRNSINQSILDVLSNGKRY